MHAGAIRILSCNPGYALSGVPDGGVAVVCDVSGVWSDNGTAQCVVATPAPAAQPTNPSVVETVTCCLMCDNFVASVFVDGAQAVLNLPTPNSYTNPRSFQFASSASTIVIHAGDNECGCRCGKSPSPTNSRSQSVSSCVLAFTSLNFLLVSLSTATVLAFACKAVKPDTPKSALLAF